MTLATSTPSDSPARGAPLPGGLREVFALAYPVVLTQLSNAAMHVIDSAMVGRLGAASLAAVGLGGVWLWTLFSLFYGATSGVQTFVAQADGAGARDECGAWVWQGLYAVLPAALVALAIVGLALEPLVAWLDTSEALRRETTAYVLARLPGELGLAIVMLLASFFRGLGDTRTPLYATLVGVAVNAVLDYGLVFGELGLPAWGVAGAGVATAIGFGVAASILTAAFLRPGLRARYVTGCVPPQWASIRRFLRTSAPIGGEWLLGMTSFAAFTTLVAQMGDVEMAASQVFVALLSLSFLQAMGIGIAAATLVGRFVGAGDPDAAERAFRSSLVLGTLLATLVALLFVTAPGSLLRVFSNDARVVAAGAPLLFLGAVFQLFDALGIISEGALRGAGDTRWPFLAHTALGWGFFLPAAHLLGTVWGYGLAGAWAGGLVYVVLLAAVLIARFRRGAWRAVSI